MLQTLSFLFRFSVFFSFLRQIISFVLIDITVIKSILFALNDITFLILQSNVVFHHYHLHHHHYCRRCADSTEFLDFTRHSSLPFIVPASIIHTEFQYVSLCWLADNEINKWKIKLATVVKGYRKISFSIATIPRCSGGRYYFPWIALLYSWYVPYNAEC